MMISCSRNIYFYYNNYWGWKHKTLQLQKLLLYLLIIMSLLSLLIHLIHPCWIQLFKKSIFTDPKIWNGSIIVEINTVPRKQAFIKGFVIYPGIRHDTSIEIQVVQSVVPVGRKKYVLNKFKLNNALKLIYSYFIYNIYLTLYFNQTRGFKCALKWHLICLTLHTFLPGN